MTRLGDGPIQPELFDKMNALALGLDEIVNEGKRGQDRDWGFVLMMFPYGDRSGRCNYISNGADRADVVTLMKEMIARFEGQPEMGGKA
jgi:hypothetical protein